MNNVVTKEEGGYMDKLLERFFAVRFFGHAVKAWRSSGPQHGRAVEAVTPVAGAAGRNGTGQGNAE